jgi:hypothetical protein
MKKALRIMAVGILCMGMSSCEDPKVYGSVGFSSYGGGGYHGYNPYGGPSTYGSVRIGGRIM